MTPLLLQQMCANLPSPGSFPPPTNPHGLRAALDIACEENPTSLAHRRLLLATQRLNTLHDTRPDRIHEVRLDALIRWDESTSTWLGTHVNTGCPYQLRILDHQYHHEPVLARCLRRDFTLLEPIYPTVRFHDGQHTAITIPLVGDPYADSDEILPLSIAIQFLGTGLSELERWATHDIVPPDLTSDELRDDQSRLVIQCLTPLATDSLSQSMTNLLALLEPSCAVPTLDLFMAATREFVTDDLQHVRNRWASVLAQTLTTRRHHIATRWRETKLAHQSGALYAAITRLQQACPAPHGRGVVGVDLNGQPLIVESTAARVCWGPASEQIDIISSDTALVPSEARRLLRARASATLNRRLHQENNGDPVFTEQICRWLATRMRVRALRLLLEATSKYAAAT